MIGQRYTVPLAPIDCAPSEALLLSLDQLTLLSHLANDVFQRVTQRVTTQHVLLSALQERLLHTRSLVETLRSQPQKATTLYSASKYPTGPLPVSSVAHYEHCECESDMWTYKRPLHRVKRHLRYLPAPPCDTSHLFVQLTHERDAKQQREDAEGLGRLPSHLPSISSILLFNTDENPYKRYSNINNLEGEAAEERRKADMGPTAAPTSIVTGADLPQFSAYQFEYRPSMGDLPTFNVPANLPLGMLASDISFGLMDSKSIAPSALPNFTSALSTLPLPNSNALPPPPLPLDLPSLPTFNGIPPAPSISTAPPPPAPPMAPLMPAPFNSSIPPPGPPGPLIPQSTNAPKKSEGGNARNALLDAIRDREKIKLKKATPIISEDEKPKEKPSSGGGGGGDMMEALRARLATRNQALNGKEGGVEIRPKPLSLSAQSSLPVLPKLKPAAKNQDAEPVDEADTKKSILPEDVLKARLQAHAKKAADEDEEWN